MSVTINGTSGVTFNDASSQNTAATGFGFKNRIINGGMTIDQRATAVTATGYSVDRWQYAASVSSKSTVSQDTGVYPTGFITSLKVLSSSAYTVGSGELFVVRQSIEGLNVSDLAWGTASAATVTLSFWTRSSLTGTFGGALLNSAENRSYPFTYTISAANTWEQKTVTIAGDTSGTWLTTNGVGIKVTFGLGVGSTLSGTSGSWAGAQYYSATGATSVVGTNGATFYITGVQLEKGSTATSFDYRPYGTELALCQRYYFKIQATATSQIFSNGYCDSTTVGRGAVNFPVTMRTNPTALEQSGTAANYSINVAAGGFNGSSVPSFINATPYASEISITVASGLTTGQGCALRSGTVSGASAYLGWSAEL